METQKYNVEVLDENVIILHMPVQAGSRTDVSLACGDLQQHSWQVEAAILRVFMFGCALRVPSLRVQDEKPWYDLY